MFLEERSTVRNSNSVLKRKVHCSALLMIDEHACGKRLTNNTKTLRLTLIHKSPRENVTVG